MKTSFKNFIAESLDDKGAFKAVFVVGIPGAGKSHTIMQLKGGVAPRVVNTDRASEYLSKKFKRPVNKDNWPLFKDDAHRITASALSGYLNGVLPLFVDGTSNDVSNILGRAGILESLGYDVGMVFVSAPLEVAIERARKRAEQIDRHVDEAFIKKVHAQAEENRIYFKDKFKFFRELHNVGDLLNDQVMAEAFKKVQGFYAEPVENPVGRRMQEDMRAKGQKFLIPEMLTKEELKKKLDGWYRT